MKLTEAMVKPGVLKASRSGIISGSNPSNRSLYKQWSQLCLKDYRDELVQLFSHWFIQMHIVYER